MQYKYPGNFYTKYESIFDRLETFNIHVPKKQRIYDWFTFFEYECMLKKNTETQRGNLMLISSHHPVKVSICSNVPTFEHPKTFISESESQLVKDMVAFWRLIQKKTYKLAKQKWGYGVISLNKHLKLQ